MDIPKFKNVFKDYSSLLVPVAIGLVAVFVFIPTQLMSNKLKEEIADESISRGNKIRSLSRNVIADGQWTVERDYQQQHERDANEIALLAERSTQRELLSYKILPEPKDTSTLIFEDFGRQFCGAVDELIARVNARDCPTEAELDRSLQTSAKKALKGRRFYTRRLGEVDATIRDIVCREKAESASVYANPADLSGYEFWREYKYATATSWDEAIKDCWYWQLAYWVIEDVIDTIGALNSGSDSVFASPVKRLLGISFTEGSKGSELRSRAGSKKKAAEDKPSYVLSIKDVLAVPCTGRFSNDDIDAVHFSASVVVSSKAVSSFMRQLCSAKQHKFRGFFGEAQEQVFKHNQITILEYNVVSIEREDSTHSLYRYGEDAVVELDLVCEYIFNKSGYDKIKPKSVKESVKESLKKLEEEKAKATRRVQRRPTRKAETKNNLLEGIE